MELARATAPWTGLGALAAAGGALWLALTLARPAYSLGIDGIWGNGTESGLAKVWSEWGDRKAWPKQEWDHARENRITLPLTKLLCTVGGKFR